jgi:hypothetical protein
MKRSINSSENLSRKSKKFFDILNRILTEKKIGKIKLIKLSENESTNT